MTTTQNWRTMEMKIDIILWGSSVFLSYACTIIDKRVIADMLSTLLFRTLAFLFSYLMSDILVQYTDDESNKCNLIYRHE